MAARTRNKKVKKKPPEPVIVNVSRAEDRQAGNRFLGSLKGLQIRAQFLVSLNKGPLDTEREESLLTPVKEELESRLCMIPQTKEY